MRDAVAAYRNDDGGFGHALEPDCRASASQPATAEMALRLLDRADAWDEGLALAACDWLDSVAPAAGGATFVLPSRHRGTARALVGARGGQSPVTDPDRARSPRRCTRRGVAHPWLDRATRRDVGPHREPVRAGRRTRCSACSPSWNSVPDRARAQAAFEKVGPLLLERGLVALDPEAAGEVHGPLDFAPLPGSIARQLFDEATIAAHLDHLAASQRDDGGWMFNWPAWSPAAEADWRGFLTVDALRVLRANGRL